MVENTLVESAIGDGKRIIGALDAIGVQVDAALWFYYAESEKWRLVLAMPIREERGSTAAYSAILEAVATLDPPVEYGPGDIRAVVPNHPIIRALAGFGGPPASLVGKRIGGAYIDGVVIDGAYVYRVPADLVAARP